MVATMRRGRMAAEEAPESGGEKGSRTLSGLDRMATLSNNRIERKGRLNDKDARAIGGHLSKFVKNTTTAEREVWLRQILKRGLSTEHLTDLQERGYGTNRAQVAENLAKHLAGRGLEGVAQREELGARKNLLHRVLTGHNLSEKHFLEEDLQDNQVVRAAHLIHGYRLGKGTIGKVLFNAAIGSEAPIVGNLLETARQRAAQDLSGGIMAELQKHGLPDIEEFEAATRERTPLDSGRVRVPRTGARGPAGNTGAASEEAEEPEEQLVDEPAAAEPVNNVVNIRPARPTVQASDPFSELAASYARGLPIDPHHAHMHKAGDPQDSQNRNNLAVMGAGALHAFVSELLQRGVNINRVHNILRSTQELDAGNAARLHHAAFLEQAAYHLDGVHDDIAQELRGARQLFISNEDARSLPQAVRDAYLKRKVTASQKGPAEHRFNPNVTPHMNLIDLARNNQGAELTTLQKNALRAFHFLRTARHGINPQGEELPGERLRKLVRNAASAIRQANSAQATQRAA